MLFKHHCICKEYPAPSYILFVLKRYAMTILHSKSILANKRSINVSQSPLGIHLLTNPNILVASLQRNSIQNRIFFKEWSEDSWPYGQLCLAFLILHLLPQPYLISLLLKLSHSKICHFNPLVSNGWRTWHADRTALWDNVTCELLHFWLLVLAAMWGILCA